MPITEILEENCRKYGNDICLVEINPEIKETKPVSWKEYGLIESNPSNFDVPNNPPEYFFPVYCSYCSSVYILQELSRTNNI